MRSQRDIEIDIAVRAAVRALAALTRQAQHLAVHRPFGNARLDCSRCAPGPSLLVQFGGGEIEAHLGAAECLFERDGDRDFVILTSPWARSSAASRSASQTREQV